MLYQSRQNLQDQTGNSWQVIVFKRISSESSAMLSLRLVGFPGGVNLDHTQMTFYRCVCVSPIGDHRNRQYLFLIQGQMLLCNCQSC